MLPTDKEEETTHEGAWRHATIVSGGCWFEELEVGVNFGVMRVLTFHFAKYKSLNILFIFSCYFIFKFSY